MTLTACGHDAGGVWLLTSAAWLVGLVALGISNIPGKHQAQRHPAPFPEELVRRDAGGGPPAGADRRGSDAWALAVQLNRQRFAEHAAA